VRNWTLGVSRKFDIQNVNGDDELDCLLLDMARCWNDDDETLDTLYKIAEPSLSALAGRIPITTSEELSEAVDDTYTPKKTRCSFIAYSSIPDSFELTE
jgi:hypothetical protein